MKTVAVGLVRLSKGGDIFIMRSNGSEGLSQGISKMREKGCQFRNVEPVTNQSMKVTIFNPADCLPEAR